MLKGKLSYVSPEQARCEPLDARSDIFSWGSTMWELLTGHRLFGGRSDYDRLQAVKRAPVMAPSRHRPEVPLALDRIVLKALERDLSKRYQTAAQVAADLDAFLKVAPPDPDAIPRLLSELYGDESLSNIGLLDGGGTNSDLSGGISYTGSSSGAGLDPSTVVESDGEGEAAPARPRAVVWAIGAALAVAIVATVSWSLRASPVAPAAVPASAMIGANVGRPASAPPGASVSAAKAVKIDVDSEPQGAVVTGSDGLLGKTPLTVTLPASRELELLRFEKPGYHPLTYEVRPESAGVVFVQLRPGK
jgi:PEGA domain